MPAPTTLAQDRKRQRRRGLLRAATGGVNLAVVGAAGAGAVALGSWPILALGGAAYAALVAWDLANPRFWARLQGGVAAPAKLPAPTALASPELRAALEEILGARQALTEVVRTTSEQVLGHLTGTLASVRELEQRAAELLGRGDALHRYLAGAGLAQVRAAVQALERKQSLSADAETRSQYSNALAARREHLRTLEQIASARERIVAHLTRLAALLSALPAQVVHLRALDAEAMDGFSGRMSEELESFTVEIDSLKETLETIGEGAPR